MPVSLFVGGVRSGKTGHAQAWAEKTAARRIYVATARPVDVEMRSRIERHRQQRGAGWLTLEEPLDPLPSIHKLCRTQTEPHALVFDCLSMWLANQLAQSQADEDILSAGRILLRGLDDLAWPCAVVSAECGLGLVPLDALGRRFIDLLGYLNQYAGTICQNVYFASCGILLPLKGNLP